MSLFRLERKKNQAFCVLVYHFQETLERKKERFSISLGVNPMTFHTASEYRLGVRGVHREEGVKLDLTLYITTIDKLELTTFKYRYILNLTGHSST